MARRRLQQLLGRVEEREFFEERYTRRWFLNECIGPNPFAGLASIEDLERLLFDRDEKDPRVLVAEDTVARPASDAGLIAEWLSGRSLVFRGIDRQLPAIWHFARDLESELKCPVWCNLYLTPPRGRAFSTHYDTHEVFIVQVIGSKKWRIGGTGKESPLPFQDRAAAAPLPAEPASEVELRAGDVLYIPRGLLHDASAKETVSCHVTVGLQPKTVLDLILASVTIAADRDPRLRAYLPLGSFDIGDEQISAAIGLMRDVSKADFRDAGSAFCELFALEARRTPIGVLELAETAGRIGEGDVFRAAPNLMCSVSYREDRLQLIALGRSIDLPLSLQRDLHVCLSGRAFRLSDLRDRSSADERVGFVRRLILEGLVQKLADGDRASVEVHLVRHVSASGRPG